MHVLSRRSVIQLAGVAGASALLAACSGNADSRKQPSRANNRVTPTTKPLPTSATDTSCPKTTPPETAGPHPGDGSNGPNVLGEEGVVRSDIRSSFGGLSGWAEGVQTTIELTLLDVSRGCAEAEGMAVYVWHCDRAGDYSLYSGDAADKNYLRGVQVAGQDGRVSFTSIFPACDAGRWPHIHFEVFESRDAAAAGENARLTSQVALPEDVCKKVFDYDKGYSASLQNMSNVTRKDDSAFGDGWDGQLATVTGDPSSAMLVTLTVGVGENSSGPPPG